MIQASGLPPHCPSPHLNSLGDQGCSKPLVVPFLVFDFWRGGREEGPVRMEGGWAKGSGGLHSQGSSLGGSDIAQERAEKSGQDPGLSTAAKIKFYLDMAQGLTTKSKRTQWVMSSKIWLLSALGFFPPYV